MSENWIKYVQHPNSYKIRSSQVPRIYLRWPTHHDVKSWCANCQSIGPRRKMTHKAKTPMHPLSVDLVEYKIASRFSTGLTCTWLLAVCNRPSLVAFCSVIPLPEKQALTVTIALVASSRKCLVMRNPNNTPPPSRNFLCPTVCTPHYLSCCYRCIVTLCRTTIYSASTQHGI